MKVFVSGGTGFVGRHLVRRLLEDGHSPRLLVRKNSLHRIPPDVRDRVEVVEGDPYDLAALLEGISGCDAVINLIGIIRDFPKKGITFERVHFEATKNIADAAREKGVLRFLQMSALGVDWDELTEYFRSKWKADQYLIDHDFVYTIFRPSVIFGEGDGFTTTIEKLIRQSPVLIIPGRGEYPLQPVSVRDVVRGFSRALTLEASQKRIYQVTGPETYTYREVVRMVASAMGKRKLALHLPLRLIIPFVIVLERFPFFPLTYDQLYMLTKGSVGDNRAFREDFGGDLEDFPSYLEKRFGGR
ncbi:MAG: complex I NDUFA9 subunit family protein [Deltaproteobacteria bacterium]|nr:MAG: complex I NDUFA9 subunit family protein [Deltaproteobacteria bacterium]